MLERDEDAIQTALVRNPSYFERGLPYLDRVSYHWITDAATQLAALQSGQITVGQLPSGTDADFKARYPSFHFGTEMDTRLWHHAMRTDQAPFNDVRVRRALAMAWNQDEVKKIWGY